jgi:hypothetical protein
MSGFLHSLRDGFDLIQNSYFVLDALMNDYDKDRVSYVINFPANLSAEDLQRWLRFTSRTVRRGQSVVFELVVTPERKIHRLKVPWQHASDIIGQVGLMPGVTARKDEEHVRFDWTYAQEFGESNADRPLDIVNVRDLAESILHSFSSLKADEAVIFQWVVAPAPREPLPTNKSKSNEFSIRGLKFSRDASGDEIKERRDKLSEPNVLGVLRIAAAANTKPRAKKLIHQVYSSLKAVESPHNRWLDHHWFLPNEKLIARVRTAKSMLLWPAQLNMTELSALIGWPIDGPYVPGMSTGRAKYLPAPLSVPKEGLIFGDANFPGGERAVALAVNQSARNIHIVGRTGSGKSEVIKHIAHKSMVEGRGMVVIDPKFDLYNELADLVPPHRIKDVILFDVNDFVRPLGFNLFTQGTPQTVASDLQKMFDGIYRSDGSAVRMPEVLYHVVMTLLTTKAGDKAFTFTDIVPLLWPVTREDKRFSKAVIDGIQDQYIKAWWAEKNRLSAQQREAYFQPLRSKIWQLNTRPEVRNIIGQSENSLDMRDIVVNKKILLVNLKGLPEDTQKLIGSALVNNLWNAIRLGGASEAEPFHLLLDEFQNFVHTPTSHETMLAEGRSSGLSQLLAHQGLDQLDGRRSLQDAVMNNAVSKIVFQRGIKDARTFAAEFASPVTDDDLKKLGQFEFIAKIQTESGISSPFTGITRPPLKPAGTGAAVRAWSRQQYGKSVAEVEQEVRERRSLGEDVSENRPMVGDEEWTEE